jgi:hypothetical protein
MGRFATRLNCLSRHVSIDAPTAGRITGIKIIAYPRRKAVEDAWLTRLNAARARYRELRDERARNTGEAPALLKSNDSKFVHLRAIHRENAALRDYKCVLIQFTNLIMKGAVPGEEALTRL